jgi:hypothetical protein
MAEEKSELSSLQERLKAMRDKQRDMEKKDGETKDTPPRAKAPPKDQPPVAPEPKAPPQDTDDAAARIRERLKKAAAPESPEVQPEKQPEKQPTEPTKTQPEPDTPPEAKPENPADRLRALLEKHRQEQQQRALEEEEEEEEAPPRPEPKPPQPAPRPPEPRDEPTPVFDPAPAPTFSPSRAFAPAHQGYDAPAAPPVRTRPTLRYRLRVGVEKLKKTTIGRLCLRGTSFFMRLTAAGSLLVLVGVSLAFMADRYCSMNDLLRVYCQKGIAPPEACQRDYGMFDVTDMRYWQQLQSYYDSGFIIPWNYVYVMVGHALAALVLGVMGLYHGPRVYRKILRFLTFPLRKLGLFRRL